MITLRTEGVAVHTPRIRAKLLKPVDITQSATDEQDLT